MSNVTIIAKQKQVPIPFNIQRNMVIVTDEVITSIPAGTDKYIASKEEIDILGIPAGELKSKLNLFFANQTNNGVFVFALTPLVVSDSVTEEKVESKSSKHKKGQDSSSNEVTPSNNSPKEPVEREVTPSNNSPKEPVERFVSAIAPQIDALRSYLNDPLQEIKNKKYLVDVPSTWTDEATHEDMTTDFIEFAKEYNTDEAIIYFLYYNQLDNPTSANLVSTISDVKSIFIVTKLAGISPLGYEATAVGAKMVDYDLDRNSTPLNYPNLFLQEITNVTRNVFNNNITLEGYKINWIGSGLDGGLDINVLQGKAVMANGDAYNSWYGFNFTAIQAKSVLEAALLLSSNGGVVLNYNQGSINYLEGGLKNLCNVLVRIGILESYILDTVAFVDVPPADVADEVYKGFTLTIKIGKFIKSITLGVSFEL